MLGTGQHSLLTHLQQPQSQGCILGEHMPFMDHMHDSQRIELGSIDGPERHHFPSISRTPISFFPG